MKAKKSRAIIIGGLLLLGMLLFWGIRSLTKYQQAEAKANEKKIEAVSVEKIMEQQNTASIMLAGAVAPNNMQKITLDAGNGEIEELSVNEGDTVTKGQKLFVYKDLETEAAIREAEVEESAKEKNVTVAQSNAQIKWSIYNERKKTATSEEQSVLAQLKGEALLADNDIASAKAALETAKQAYQAAVEQREKKIVKADMDGQIKSLNQELLQKSVDERGKENFIEIVDESSLYVKGTISEFDREKVKIDQPVEIIDRKNPQNKWTGKITKLAHLAASDNQENDKKEEENPNLSKYPYTVKFEGSENAPLLGAHMYVKVLSESAEGGQIRLPKEYIQEGSGGNKKQQDTAAKTYFVWKVVKNKVTKQMVTIAEQQNDDEWVVIKEGVNQKDQLVYPVEGISEGMEVGQSVAVK